VATVVVTPADDGTVVHAAVGDRVELRLPENPSTGYLWQLDDLAEGLAIADDRHEQATSALPGASGMRIVVLAVTAPCEHVLAARRGRPWEADEPAVEALRVAISVPGGR